MERLHTRLYLNESECLISSMNLYESSKDNNFEVGYHFKNRTQAENFKETVIDNDILMTQPEILRGRYFSSLESEEKRTHNEQNSFRQNDLDNGFCIRCGDKIELNPAYPLCNDCYSVWADWENYNYGENYCHICRVEDSVGFLFIYSLLSSFLARALHTAKTNDAIATIVETIAQRSIMLSYPVIAGLLVLVNSEVSAYHHRGADEVYCMFVFNTSDLWTA